MTAKFGMPVGHRYLVVIPYPANWRVEECKEEILEGWYAILEHCWEPNVQLRVEKQLDTYLERIANPVGSASIGWIDVECDSVRAQAGEMLSKVYMHLQPYVEHLITSRPMGRAIRSYAVDGGHAFEFEEIVRGV